MQHLIGLRLKFVAYLATWTVKKKYANAYKSGPYSLLTI